MQTSFAYGPGGRDKDGKPKAAARSRVRFPDTPLRPVPSCTKPRLGTGIDSPHPRPSKSVT
jgi:hypothetical protein